MFMKWTRLLGESVRLEDKLRMAIQLSGKLGAIYSEARYQSNSVSSFILMNGSLERVNLSRSKGIAIRIIANGSLGFSSTNDMGSASIRKAVELAISSAKATKGLAMPPVQLSEEDLSSDKVIVKPRIRFEDVGFDSAVDLLREADANAIKSTSVRNAKMASRILRVESNLCEKLLITSDGASVYSSIPRTSFGYTLIGIHPQNGSAMRSSTLGESRGWEAIERWDVVKLMNEEGEIMGRALDEGISPPKERVDMLIGGEVVGLICHESSGHPGEADRILGREAAQAGESYLSLDSVGREVGSPLVNVVDDPTLPGSYGFYLYDEEGVKARKRYLIEEGRIGGFLHNRETGAATGTKSNGASRSTAYNREPIVRMANTYLEPGDMPFEELIEDIGKGVYVRNYTEWNIDDRRFNQRYIGFEAYLIENGELGTPVRNPIIEMTTVGLYGAVDAVGDDLRFWGANCGKGDPMQGVPVWTGGPTIRLRDVKLGGA